MACRTRTTSPTCSPRAAAEQPDAARRRRGRRAAGSPGPSSTTRSAGGDRARRGRARRRPPGDDRDGQPDRVRDGLPRRAARPGGRRTRSTRRSTAGELARMIADSGSRLVVADADTVGVVRAAVAVEAAQRGELDQLDEAGPASRCAPLVVVVGGDAAAGERGTTDLRADAGRAVPPLQDPEKLAALLYTSGTSGRPRAAMLSHRALLANIEQVARSSPPMIHGDDVVLGVLPLFHVYGLNAVLGGVLRQRAQAGARERFEPAGDARPDRGRGVQRGAGRAAGLRRLAADGGPRASGSGRCGWCCPVGAPRDGRGRAVRRRDRRPGAPGLRPDRGRAGRDQHAVQRGRAAGSVGAALPGHRDPARRRRRPRRPRARTRARSRSAAPTCSAATGPTARTAPTRGLVGHRRRRFPRPRRRPVPRRPAQGARDRLGLQRLPGRGRGRDRARSTGSRARRHRGRRTSHRRGRRRLRRRAPGPTRTVIADAVRAHCAERLARFKRPTRIEVVDELPLHRHRQGPEGPAARLERRRALGLLRVNGDPVTAAVTLVPGPGCHLCDDAREVVERVCADLGET